jgi:hypothetical protein
MTCGLPDGSHSHAPRGNEIPHISATTMREADNKTRTTPVTHLICTSAKPVLVGRVEADVTTARLIGCLCYGYIRIFKIEYLNQQGSET